ncbi:hypothetical protein M407DRAFT_158324 [Tulasnella calospora MUT 4182]|uniref:Uncharacterized protein n=1 Tax=Tulasnella calospora MUT 4182 TaxID=1051891 RepID=A0A0C3QR09_9AGAM|nr:hypothetical protein M407DRAFT_158324 [Tulasnella calospora MUT 4182]
MEGKQRDNAWIADFAALCFAGDALRWYETLDDDVQLDWSKLRRAVLDWLPNTAPRPVDPRLSVYSAAPHAARASSPALAASPTAASPAPAPAPPTPTATAAFPQEKTIPFLEGTFQITSMNGNSMGYLSRVVDADATYPRTNSRYSALRVSFALLPDRHTIKLLDLPGGDQFLGLTWRNLAPSDWTKSEKYTSAIVPISFIPSESKWRSGNFQDKGASQHHIWTLSRDKTLQASYIDNAGAIHRLQSVASKGERIRFVRDVEKFVKNDPNYTQVRLVFTPDD